MTSAIVRLVVDVNVLVSSFMGGELAGLSSMLADDRFQVFTSNEQLAELLDVVERPKFRKYFTLTEAREFFADFCLVSESTTVPTPIQKICRDPKDDYLLLMAKKGKAEVLVTGDKDLLVMERYKDTAIMNAKTFTDAYLK